MDPPVDDFERLFRARYRAITRYIYLRVSDRERVLRVLLAEPQAALLVTVAGEGVAVDG